VWAFGSGPLPARPRIVAAVDASSHDPVTQELNRQAVETALFLAGPEEGALTVMQVWRPVAEKRLYVHASASEFGASVLSAENRAGDDLERLASSFGRRLARARLELRRGTAAEVIPEFALAEGIDIVVVGSRGGTGVWHPLFGSTAGGCSRRRRARWWR
jgi:nucleotide-binding universal stress UspA family protein